MRSVLTAALISSLIALATSSCGAQALAPVSQVPPARGALFGAYVDPPDYVEADRISAFERFEELLGRRLDIFHDYHAWSDPFPAAADTHFATRGTLVLLSWAGADTREIVSGRYDDLIRQRAADLRALDRPLLLEWRWEMNRPNLAAQIHSPADYVAAWRHIHDIFAQVGVRRLAWVWCPLADARADPDFGAYYPGDAYVDWIGADGYVRSPEESFGDIFSSFLAWARNVDKPIIIGEFGRSRSTPGSRTAWLRAAETFVKADARIKAVVYFESPRGASGDYAVSTDPSALSTFRDWSRDTYFWRH